MSTLLISRIGTLMVIIFDSGQPTNFYCRGWPGYLLDPISASMHAIDCVKRVLLIIVSVSTHQRPNLASGISLYVSDDPRGSNVCVTSPRRVL